MSGWYNDMRRDKRDDNDTGVQSGNDSALVGRGGLKLRAAIEHFDLGKVVRGARVVDVGASTGGFTQVLLLGDATSVLCVDAGHGQLHESLRQDPRVRSLENTDWKRLSLSDLSAAGPFDFFTVDVSFVAARNMLRGLAFRLRAGAEGVVLIKPQFELPDHLVRAGDVSDSGLRRQAVRRFTHKAESLGFHVASQIDSPVAGGEGTIEILAHLRFEGRSDRLPRPGERRSVAAPGPGSQAKAKAKSKRAAEAMVGDLDWFAVVSPGLEEIAAREAAALMGEARVNQVPGGVELRGPLEAGMRANLHLRIPTRLLLRLGTVRAREFGKLRHLLARLPWGAFIPAHTPVRITVSATHCRLYHTGAIEEAVRAAMGDHMGTAPEKPAAPAPAPEQPARPALVIPLVLVRGVDDTWTISVDSSGERLHKRGWRPESGEAPLRESLAAALLALVNWKPSEALLDPMCGAGTIAIEACTTALGIAPGLRRAFAFERWPSFAAPEANRWNDLRGAAENQRVAGLPAPIAATDRDAMAVSAARHNAVRAGVESHIEIAERALLDATPPAGWDTGLVIANPPYGERLGHRRDLPQLYRDIGRTLGLRFPGWRAAIVVPDVRLASAFRMPIAATHTLMHGGLRITVLQFEPRR